MAKKELLFSVGASDCRWDYYVGSGNGGQNKQKRNTAVRCTHPPSGAVGTSQDGRSQEQNKQLAFKRMAESKEFKTWHKMEVARRTGILKQIEEQVDRMMDPSNIKVEGKNEKGLWEEIE